jgi:hypothetical protein
MWGFTGISGRGGSAGIMPKVWESEDGGTGVDSEQSLLHESVCLLCRTEVSKYDDKRCGKGAKAGLGNSKDIRQRVYGEAA